jgi:hypothetical protein
VFRSPNPPLHPVRAGPFLSANWQVALILYSFRNVKKDLFIILLKNRENASSLMCASAATCASVTFSEYLFRRNWFVPFDIYSSLPVDMHCSQWTLPGTIPPISLNEN